MAPPSSLRKRTTSKRPFLISTTAMAPWSFYLYFCFCFCFCFSHSRCVSVSAYAPVCPGSKTPPLVLRGKRFYDSSTDEYVPIRGIAYYPRPNAGPLSEGSSVDFYTNEYASRWQTDISNLKELGVNAVRIYAVDPSANHDAFMCALSEAGIYVMLGLLADCEGCAIGAWVGVDAEPPTCYPESVKERGKFVIRSFSRYPNLLAFSAGNEVTIYADDGAGGPREANIACQKKFLRDMREYVAGCSGSYPNAVLPRAIPIGVVNWDGNSQSFQQHIYYHCRTDPEDVFEPAEWFALNTYRHCDGTATTPDDIVGWQLLREDFRVANLPGPVLLGEYGCRERGFPTMDGFETQRTWLQTEALYSPDYSDVFAGGFVFEYSAEKKVVDDNLEFFQNKQGLDEPTSEWPYQKFAKIQYGIGYFGPSDCQHVKDSDADDGDDGDSISGGRCEYTKYPEWDGLARALVRSRDQTVPTQGAGTVPVCPFRFPSLSDYDWPTDRQTDPDLEYCLELQRLAETETKDPTTTMTDSPTGSPTTAFSLRTPAPTAGGTEAPTVVSFRTQAPTTFVPTTFVPTTSTSSGSITLTSTEIPTNGDTNKDDGTNDGTNPTESPTTADFTTIAPTPVTVDMAQCSEHARCASQNLTGSCCPTVDGVLLGCCDVDTDDETSIDGSESKSSSPPSLSSGVALRSLFAGIVLCLAIITL